MKKIFLLFLVSLALLTACVKHSNDVRLSLPEYSIVFASPLAGAVYHTSDTVNINALAVSSAVVHGYDIAVKKANDTTTYFFEHVHDHNDTLLVNKQWKNTLTSPGGLEAVLTLYLDHDGHTAIRKVLFSAQ